jgi:hypothetical protein
MRAEKVDETAKMANIFPVVRVAIQGKDLAPNTNLTMGMRSTIKRVLRGRAKKVIWRRESIRV